MNPMALKQQGFEPAQAHYLTFLPVQAESCWAQRGSDGATRVATRPRMHPGRGTKMASTHEPVAVLGIGAMRHGMAVFACWHPADRVESQPRGDPGPGRAWRGTSPTLPSTPRASRHRRPMLTPSPGRQPNCSPSPSLNMGTYRDPLRHL